MNKDLQTQNRITTAALEFCRTRIELIFNCSSRTILHDTFSAEDYDKRGPVGGDRGDVGRDGFRSGSVTLCDIAIHITPHMTNDWCRGALSNGQFRF